MRTFYLIFYLFLAPLTNWAQPDKQEKAVTGSLEKLLNKINTISKNDRVQYEQSLKVYLQKAKQEQQPEHLFNAYLFYVFYESDPGIMHKYTDSLTQLAKNTQQQLNVIKAYQTRSAIYYIEKNYKKSLEYELGALQLIDKNGQPYEYNKSLYSIGQIHFYLQDYHEAAKYFVMARTYFEQKDDYNHLLGYMNSLRYEALTACYSGEYKHSIELIKTGSKKLASIKKDDRSLEKAYLDYVYGLNLYHLQQYQASIDALNDALTNIIKNEDYANEHNIYYFLGLNYWESGNKERAFFYFNKIDEVFNKKHYSNLEIKNAYNYLTAYFKELKNEEKELYYTNQLLNVTIFLQNEYRYLSSTLHKQLDIKHLEFEKERLEKSLRKKNIWLYTAVVLGSIGVVIFVIILVKARRKEKEFAKHYKEFETVRKALKSKEDSLETLKLHPDTRVTTVNTSKHSSAVSNETLNVILTHLDTFEKNMDFLQTDISLNDLAKQWSTNRTYLSQFINKHKGKNFIDYLNHLRIDYLLKKLEEEPQWKDYKINHISDLLGFPSSRSFSNAFSKITGMSPSYYIQKRIKEDLA